MNELHFHFFNEFLWYAVVSNEPIELLVLRLQSFLYANLLDNEKILITKIFLMPSPQFRPPTTNRDAALVVVVAQLVERLLPTPEIPISNLNIGKLFLPIVHLNRKDKNKEKEAGNDPSLKKQGRCLFDPFSVIYCPN